MTNEYRPYKLDVVKNTLTITKEFEKRLNSGDEEALAVITKYNNLFNDLTIKRASHRVAKDSKNGLKGMTYKKMEDYITLFENNEEVLLNFNKIKQYAKTQGMGIRIVAEWFIKQFPEYSKKELPPVKEGKMYINNVIDIADYRKEEEKEELLKEASNS